MSLQDFIKALKSKDEARILELANSIATGEVDCYGNTPLMWAAKYSHTAAIEALIRRKASVDARDVHGTTALMHAVQRWNLAIIEALIAEGADVNAHRGIDSETPLMFAVRFNHVVAIKALIKKGANIETLSTHQETALSLAVRYNHVDAVNALLDEGADFLEYDERSLEDHIFHIESKDDYDRYALGNALYKRPFHLVLHNPTPDIIQGFLAFLTTYKDAITTVRIKELSEEGAELLKDYLPARELAKLGLRNFIIENLAHTQEHYPDYYMASYVADKIKTDWKLIPLNAHGVIAKNLAFLSSDFSEDGIFGVARENFKALGLALAAMSNPKEVEFFEKFFKKPEVLPLLQDTGKTTEGIKEVEVMSKPGIRVPSWASRLLEMLCPKGTLTIVSNAIFKPTPAKESGIDGSWRETPGAGGGEGSGTLDERGITVTGGGGGGSGTPDDRDVPAAPGRSTVTATGGTEGDIGQEGLSHVARLQSARQDAQYSNQRGGPGQ